MVPHALFPAADGPGNRKTPRGCERSARGSRTTVSARTVSYVRSLRTGAPAANNRGEREHGGSLAHSAPVSGGRLRMRAVPGGGAGTRTGWRQAEGGGRRGPAPALVAARASAQLVHPAVLVLGRAALDVEQGLAQLLRDLSGLAAALLPLGTGPLDGADGGDDGGGAAGEDLGEGAVLRVALPLVDGDPLLDGLVAQVAGDAQQGVTGDALQDGPGEGGRDDPVAVDEVQVHAAQFLDPGVLHGVEVADLVAALGGGLGLGEQGGRVVAAGLGVAHAAGDGADPVLGDPDGHRLDAAREVGAGRG